MKKCKINICVGMIISILYFSSMNILAASQNEAAYLEKYQSILQTMETGMENAPKTGDPALDYLYQMIPHHEAAIAISENVLQYGTNQKVKQMAQKIVKEQTADIGEVRELIEKIKANPQIDQTQADAYRRESMQIHEDMMNKMKSIKPTCNVDKNFLLGMIPHHEGAVNMSRSVLKYTDNTEVKRMAENTIKKQAEEIKETEKLLNQIK